MRKLIYSVSVFMFLFVLSSAFYNSYQVSLLRDQVKELEELQDSQTLTVGTPTTLSGYYLKETEGKVCVFRGDKVTVYEQTSIPLDILPNSLQKEISQGKYLESEIELYNFLENYSS